VIGVLPDSRDANLALIAVCWSLLLGWQAVTALSGRWPSFGALVALAREWRPVRWALLLLWCWLGWHLFVQTTP
jgi:hypothetical protein